MEHFARLDVGTHLTSVCVIDAKGEIQFEAELATDPDLIAKALKKWRASLRQIGHEAGSMAPWLHKELAERGLKMVCLEAFHARQAMKAQRNKTDKHDARGIAHLVRSGWIRSVHIKSDASYRLRFLLGQRSLLVRKRVDIENTIRQSLKVFGLRITGVNRSSFEAKARELVAEDTVLAGLVEAMLKVRTVLVDQIAHLHKLVLACAREDELTLRFMEIPGVGPVTALLFKATIDDPSRFKSAKDVGAYFGLTPKRWQSGETIDRQGRISKMGDRDVRRSLFEAAHILLVAYRGKCALKTWGQKLLKAKGHHKAAVAVARRLSMVMWAMWRDGTVFEANGSAPELQSSEAAPKASRGGKRARAVPAASPKLIPA